MIYSLYQIFDSYRFIFNQISLKYRLILLFCLLQIFLAAIFDMSALYLIGFLISNVDIDVNLKFISVLNSENAVLGIIFFTFLAASFRLISSRYSLYIGDKIYVNFSINMYNLIFEKEIEFIDRINIDRLTSLIFNNSSRIPEFIYILQSSISSTLLILLTLIFTCIIINPIILFSLFACALLIYAFSTAVFSYKTRNLGVSLTAAYEDLSRLLRNTIYSSRFLKTTNGEISEYKNSLSYQLRKKRKSQSRELFYSGLPRNIAEPTIYGSIGILYLFFKNFKFTSLDIFSISVISLVRILPQLQIISSCIPTLNSASKQLLELKKVINLLKEKETEVIEINKNKKIEKHKKVRIDKIILTDIDYHIPDYPNFQDSLLSALRVNKFQIRSKKFVINSGQSYLLNAPNGSGKSIFLDILTCLRKPQKGKVKFLSSSGEIIKVPKIRYLYQNEQLLGQNIISYLVGRNISNFNQLNKNEIFEVEKFRKKLNINFIKNINNFKKDYFMPNDSRDIQYSGGQKQKIMIWSALINNPDLLVLDESLSAIDNESSRNILELILNEYKNKIFIFISHDKDLIDATYFSNKITIKDNFLIVDE